MDKSPRAAYVDLELSCVPRSCDDDSSQSGNFTVDGDLAVSGATGGIEAMRPLLGDGEDAEEPVILGSDWPMRPPVSGFLGGTSTYSVRELQATQHNYRNGGISAAAMVAAAVEPAGKDDHQAETEMVELAHDCYAMILISGRAIVLVPMLVVVMGQFGVLWLVAWSSPEYLFESGQWIVPISEYWPVNAMKCFSLLLTLFRVTGEFRDALKLYHVLTHSTRGQMRICRRMVGAAAFVLQYVVALIVMFMAIHLILASTTPITAIGKLWVVWMVLDFDNHLCNFMLFILGLERVFDWKVPLQRWTRKAHYTSARPGILLFWAPMLLGVLCATASMYLNVCPLTALHYGTVTNKDPVLMLSSSFGLPGGCCPPQVAWDDEEKTAHPQASSKIVTGPKAAGLSITSETGWSNVVNVSVPCLSPVAPSSAANSLSSSTKSQSIAADDASISPRIHFVVVPDGRPSPSSVQVLQGRSGDGNRGLISGSVVAWPLQMRWWLGLYGFPAGAYDRMRNRGAGGLGLYRSSFPFVAEWTIPDFPFGTHARIFAAAQNPLTGALSPVPVQSSVIIRKLCLPNCVDCNSDGFCLKCDLGFVLAGNGRSCLPCGQGCDVCNSAGSGQCDLGGCGKGYGFSTNSCIMCEGSHCLSCSPRAEDNITSSLSALPCTVCDKGFGSTPNVGCMPCLVLGCASCSNVEVCESCLPGYKLQLAVTNSANATCEPCADHCLQCDLLGRGRCDPGGCNLEFSLSAQGMCAPCSGHCLNCTTSGPGSCDIGSCRAGYGLQGTQTCSRCQVEHCNTCDIAWDSCDACGDGFGITPEQTCEACAEACERCTSVGDCAKCRAGFGLVNGHCIACADQCGRCDLSGPGHCDEGHCLAGWTIPHGADGGRICTHSINRRQATSQYQMQDLVQ